MRGANGVSQQDDPRDWQQSSLGKACPIITATGADRGESCQMVLSNFGGIDKSLPTSTAGLEELLETGDQIPSKVISQRMS